VTDGDPRLPSAGAGGPGSRPASLAGPGEHGSSPASLAGPGGPGSSPASLSGSGPAVPSTDLDALLRSKIRDVPDYPRPGVLFKDITPLLADSDAFDATVAALAAGNEGVDKVVGIEARGFILAAPVALALHAGFVPVRKAGKLPAQTYAQTYELEYGTATVEVHTDAFVPGDRVLIVDDVLATGGTAAAAAELVGRSGATVTEIAVLLELGFLAGREKLPGLRVRALLAT
jgi:adenine phosphoribosyltransferase